MPEHVVPDPGRLTAPKLSGRWRVSLAAFRARLEARRALREEQTALLRIGEALASARPQDGDGLRDALAEVAGHRSAAEAVQDAVSATLLEDRADYAMASPWIRPLVIARGVAARCVLRERLQRVRNERAAACRRLGAAALEQSVAIPGEAAASGVAARAARVRADTASSQAEALLAPFGGSVLPRPVFCVGREVAAFSKPLAKEVRGQLLPRVPALTGLAVGWWLASTFTDSRFSATLHSLGIGSGPRRVMSSGTLRALSFWLPILAAALCSYAGSRLGALVRARYAPGTPNAGPEGRAQDDGVLPRGTQTCALNEGAKAMACDTAVDRERP
ncbi:MAG: hypothetical protein A2V77_12730 [Anaeromyxobacter sp. RBG_16_69_14]|nr:MAG: hypothetical protein A2V77_12730 [Anaeromyxobacter sp. RBG_16_69_14]